MRGFKIFAKRSTKARVHTHTCGVEWRRTIRVCRRRPLTPTRLVSCCLIIYAYARRKQCGRLNSLTHSRASFLLAFMFRLSVGCEAWPPRNRRDAFIAARCFFSCRPTNSPLSRGKMTAGAHFSKLRGTDFRYTIFKFAPRN